MEEKKPLNVPDDIKIEIITKLILIKLIENFSYEKVIDNLYKREKDESELYQVISVIKQKINISKLTNIMFDLEELSYFI